MVISCAWKIRICLNSPHHLLYCSFKWLLLRRLEQTGSISTIYTIDRAFNDSIGEVKGQRTAKRKRP